MKFVYFPIFIYRREKKVSVQNGSSCYNKPVIGHWLMYDEMVKQSSNMYIKGVSPISTLTVSIYLRIPTAFFN